MWMLELSKYHCTNGRKIVCVCVCVCMFSLLYCVYICMTFVCAILWVASRLCLHLDCMCTSMCFQSVFASRLCLHRD